MDQYQISPELPRLARRIYKLRGLNTAWVQRHLNLPPSSHLDPPLPSRPHRPLRCLAAEFSTRSQRCPKMRLHPRRSRLYISPAAIAPRLNPYHARCRLSRGQAEGKIYLTPRAGMMKKMESIIRYCCNIFSPSLPFGYRFLQDPTLAHSFFPAPVSHLHI